MKEPWSEPNGSVALFAVRKLRPFLLLSREREIAVEPLLAACGLSTGMLSDPEARLPRLRCIAAIRALSVALGEPLLGLLAAERSELGDMDLVGYIAQQYEDVLSALQVVVDYAALVGDSSRAELSVRNGEVKLCQWVAGDESLLPELADYQVASSHRAISLFANRRVDALRVELARPAPAHSVQGAYRRFFGCPVRFGVKRGALFYAESALRVRRGPGDPRLAQLLLEQADQRLAGRADACLAAQVRTQVVAAGELLELQPAQVAAQLGVSERTLRRRLEEQGTSYREILDDVRRQRALTLLEVGHLRVGEVAARVGFSDLTGFSRAFRRWTGMSPSEYQRSRTNRSTPQRSS